MPDLSALSDESLWCREEKHSFAFLHDKTTVNAKGRLIAWRRLMQCRECGAMAHRDIDPTTLQPSPRKIATYPHDYLVKGQGRISAQDVMRESFRRLKVVA